MHPTWLRCERRSFITGKYANITHTRRHRLLYLRPNRAMFDDDVGPSKKMIYITRAPKSDKNQGACCSI